MTLTDKSSFPLLQRASANLEPTRHSKLCTRRHAPMPETQKYVCLNDQLPPLAQLHNQAVLTRSGGVIRRCEELKDDRKNWDLLWLFRGFYLPAEWILLVIIKTGTKQAMLICNRQIKRNRVPRVINRHILESAYVVHFPDRVSQSSRFHSSA